MRLPSDPAPYHAYLLRCWLERGPGPNAPGVWRFSLEDPHTGAQRGFASFASLVDFIARMLAGHGDGAQEAPGAGGRLADG